MKKNKSGCLAWFHCPAYNSVIHYTGDYTSADQRERLSSSHQQPDQAFSGERFVGRWSALVWKAGGEVSGGGMRVKNIYRRAPERKGSERCLSHRRARGQI